MVKLISARSRSTADCLTRPVVRQLAKTPLTPNAITWSGFLITIGAAVLIGTGHLFAAGWLVLVTGYFDILDGALARHTGRTSRFGAVLDSTLDRFSEAALLLGILAGFAVAQSVFGVLLAGIALVASLMVSYIRARAEGEGLDCQVGLFTRTERVLVLVLGLLLSSVNYALLAALALIAALALVTVGQRLFHVWRQTNK